MVKKPAAPSVVERIPSVEGGMSAIASGNAPVIFFDHISNFGTYNGIAHITLVVMRFLQGPDNAAVQDNAVAAHLRMNIPALMALKETISKIELMLAKSDSGMVN